MSEKSYEFICQSSPGRPSAEGIVSASPVYRSKFAENGFETSLDGCSTLFELFTHYCDKYQSLPFHGKRKIDQNGTLGPYEWETYREVHLTVQVLAQSLQQNGGCRPGSKIGIYGQNSPEWSKAMQACNLFSGVCVPIYDSLSKNAAEFIIIHSEMDFIFLADSKVDSLALTFSSIDKSNHQVSNVCIWETNEKADTRKSEEFLTSIGIRVWKWDDFINNSKTLLLEEFPEIPPNPEDICTIMYTSGTTGFPKGVILSHRALVSAIIGIEKYARAYDLVREGDVSLSYLTLAHIFGRIIDELALSKGARLGFWQGRLDYFLDDIQTLKPTILVGVPRVWELIFEKVVKQVEKKGFVAKFLFNWGVSRKSYFMKEGYKEAEASPIFDKLIFTRIKDKLGGNLRVACSGAAPLPAYIEKLFRTTLAIPALQGYGLTETCAATFLAVPDRYDMFGTVGPMLACGEFKLESVPEMGYFADSNTPRGEVCVRGPCLFSGYYKSEEEYMKAIDKDGFFHTGDVAELCDNSALRIIDRIKNIFKLSQGEYVAVEHIESVLSDANSVDQIWVYGNSNQRYLVAVVVPKKLYFKSTLENSENTEALCESEEVKKIVMDQLNKVATSFGLKGYEKIKKIHLSKEHFTINNGLLTPSFKLKRHELLKKFKNDIDALYEKD